VAERGKWNMMLEDAHVLFHENKLDKALVRYMYLAETGFELAINNAAFVLDYIGKHYPGARLRVTFFKEKKATAFYWLSVAHCAE
jgi:hypothetical protein